MEPLPVDDVLQAVVEALRRGPSCVVVAPPGAGKTTRVPPALAAAGLVPRCLVLLQPRRVAARAAARRIAEEQGWTLGREVGYQVRFERRLTDDTRLQIVTEGILTRRLLADPCLEGVDVVVLDEFHLRTVDADLALAMLVEAQRTVRPELRVVVMSATLEAGPVAAFLGGCPVVESRGRLHEVTVEYEARGDRRPLEARAAAAARRALRSSTGHVLVFLPGAREIRRTAELLGGALDARVLPLHGSLSPEEQDRAARPGAERAVVLATNVAETSLTIPGVTAVVDGGMVRLPVLEPRLGLDRLELRRISRDAAEQRAGRAGRTGPGRVLRLWTETEQAGLLARTEPDIRRVDLARAALEVAGWGSAPEAFPWFEAPDPARLAAARRLLEALGAMDPAGRATPAGRRMLALPLHPRLARMVAVAHAAGHLAPAAALAAVLSERDALDRRPPPGGVSAAPSDVLLRSSSPELSRVRDDLMRQARSALGPAPERPATEEDLLHLLLHAFPDRVARRRRPGDERAVMVGGRGLVLSKSSVVRHEEFFLAVDVDAAPGGDALVHQASAVDPAWLETHEESVLAFDGATGRVTSTRRWLYGDLIVRERPEPADPAASAAVLAEAAARDPEASLAPDEDARSLRNRVSCLRSWMPDLGLPALDDGALRDLLPQLCVGLRSLDELRRVPLAERLRAILTHQQRAALDRHAPERLPLPSGATARLEYEPGRPPVLVVQLQNLFGCGETPTVAAGRVRVLLHLTSPAGRPVQVTDDLRGFWGGAYQEVRKELRARYPRHSWPEDPWSARPERRPRPKARR